MLLVNSPMIHSLKVLFVYFSTLFTILQYEKEAAFFAAPYFLKNDHNKHNKHCDHEEKPKCTAQTAAMMMVMPWRSWRSHVKTKMRSWRMMRHSETRSWATASAHTRSAMKSTGSSASWPKHKTSTPFSSSVLLYRKNFAKPFLFIDCLNLPAQPAYATIKAPNLFCIRRILWN